MCSTQKDKKIQISPLKCFYQTIFIDKNLTSCVSRKHFCSPSSNSISRNGVEKKGKGCTSKKLLLGNQVKTTY